jgi:type IV pilus assembly protein PilM
MKKFFQELLPKKKYFIGIDIGTYQIKVAEIKIIDGALEVIALRCCPSPPDVWTDQLEEESLVQALKEVANPKLKEVITCIGGEKLVSRIVRLPHLSAKELGMAVQFEVEKLVPTPVNRLIIRHIRLENNQNSERESSPEQSFSGLQAEKFAKAKEAAGNQEGQNVLILAVPAAIIYQYHSIFSRAGLIVTAVDLQAFALWRLFGRNTPGTVAIVNLGAATSQLVIVKDGVIQFLRLLPVGGNILTNSLVEHYGINFTEAQQMKEEAAVTGNSNQYSPAIMSAADFNTSVPNGRMAGDSVSNPVFGPAGELIRTSFLDITKELHRSLEFCSTQENLWAEKLILSGGTGKLKGLAGHLQDALGIPVETGVPEVYFAEGETFDPVFTIAIGLALREATE